MQIKLLCPPLNLIMTMSSLCRKNSRQVIKKIDKERIFQTSESFSLPLKFD